MFGRGRLSNGVVIEPISYEEMAKVSVAEFRNFILYFLPSFTGFLVNILI
jgi:hypothetical protein